MFMTSLYELLDRGEDLIWCRYLSTVEYCPQCDGILLERDRRKRVIRFCGGRKKYIIIRRMYCPACDRIHTELPDILLPHKQYSADVIEAVADGNLTEEDPRTIEGPGKVSMKLWISWLKSSWEHLSDLYINAVRLFQSEHKRNSEHYDELPASFRLLREYGAGWLSDGISFIYFSGFCL